MKRLNNRPELKERRIELRKNSTAQEERLWAYLRQHKLGIKFKRQHSIGPYILDFYCPLKKLAIELDGSHHLGNQEYDLERFYYLSNLDIQIIRFWNKDVDVNIDHVLTQISSALRRGRQEGVN